MQESTHVSPTKLTQNQLIHRRRTQDRRRIASRYRRSEFARRRSSSWRGQLTPQRVTGTLRAPPSIVEGEVVSTQDDYQHPEPPPKPARRIPVPLLAAIAALSLAVGAGLALVLVPLLTATATVTLTPEAHTLSVAATITASARPGSEVHAHIFAAERESLSRTIATTGTATWPASAARGAITFYNALPSPQTIAAGTLLVSASGVAVLTEQAAYLPAAAPPVDGVATVSAQSENSGPEGNLPAGAIQGPCCRGYVLAYSGAFSGGADSRTYHTPTRGDITSTAVPLSLQADQRMQSTIGGRLQPGEVLLAPRCKSTTTSSAQPGAEADQITIAVEEICSAAAYDQSELQQAATARLATLASQQLGPAYRGWGAVQATITASSVTGDRVAFQLQLTGVYVYGFSERQLERLRAQLAGVSRDQAAALLHHLAGVSQAGVQSSRATLPGDPARIHILLFLPAL